MLGAALAGGWKFTIGNLWSEVERTSLRTFRRYAGRVTLTGIEWNDCRKLYENGSALYAVMHGKG